MRTRIQGAATILALSVLLVACGKKAGAPEGSGPKAIDTAQLAPPPTPAPAPAADTVRADTAVPTHIARLETSMGNIELELYGNDAPKTVKNFVELAGKKYYDGVAFHRVVPNFMVQTGDPFSRDSSDRSKWGTGGESIYGPTFADELDHSKPSAQRGYVTGTVAMANGGPNTNGSQFFIVLNTMGAAHLTFNYTIFGAVRSGMDVLHKIEETGRAGEKPEHPAVMKSVTVTEVPGVGANPSVK